MKRAPKTTPRKTSAKVAPSQKKLVPTPSPVMPTLPRKAPDTFRVLSWNVNGLRSIATKGFLPFLSACDADVIGIQESRSEPADLDEALRAPAGFHAHFVAAERKGYSGVALYARHAPDSVESTLGDPTFDCEGRYQCARFGELLVVNGYFPNGSGKERDNSRIPYKLEFYRRVFDLLEPHRRAGKPVLVMGDFNTAHREIDLARPKENRKTSGFCDEERGEFDRWIGGGWIDTFRAFEPSPGHYSWWSQRFGVREKNIGWRIDYVLASEAAMRYVRGAILWPQVRGSDHCPVGVELDSKVLGKMLQ
jgi:exodeoxyribonuclease III